MDMKMMRVSGGSVGGVVEDVEDVEDVLEDVPEGVIEDVKDVLEDVVEDVGSGATLAPLLLAILLLAFLLLALPLPPLNLIRFECPRSLRETVAVSCFAPSMKSTSPSSCCPMFSVL
jgi:hypothetical protein